MVKTSRMALIGSVALIVAGVFCALPGLPGLPSVSQGVRAETAGFRGQVTDMLTGQPIDGALVSAGSISTHSDSQGRFELQVSPSTYEVGVRADGYISMSQTGQVASAGHFSTLDFGLVLAHPDEDQSLALDAMFLRQHAADQEAEAAEGTIDPELSAAGVSTLPASIRVLMPDGLVVVMPLDEYLRGVLPREMPPYWPIEALKAQAVAARCYAATARRHGEADVCTTAHCQVWSPTHYETTDRAVNETHNVSASYAGNIINAYYFAHCDGHTRDSEAVWGSAVAYCRGVSCPCGFSSLSGHGVGLCQEGARVWAANGADYRQILTQYYTGVQISAPPQAVLSSGRVYPSDGDSTTDFTYEVTYSGGDKPIATDLYIDGYSYGMEAVAEAVDGGTVYRYQTSLQPGEHTFGFHFEDGHNLSTNLPRSGSLNGPSVRVRSTELPTPAPTATPDGTQAAQWSQTTQKDFSAGTFSNTLLTREDNGEISLQPGSSVGTYISTVKMAPIQFAAVGSKWQASLASNTALTISVRTSTNGSTWSDWFPIPPMDAQREDTLLSFGELIYLPGPYMQYRIALSTRQPGMVPSLRAITFIFIDPTRGPTAAQAQAAALATAATAPVGPTIIPRAGWGADETLMTWPPEYRTIRKFVIHHTATPNGSLDAAATVRAIYYYHAVTRGWGDIGYNYLIDTQGRIYEGRSGGEGVVGGHAKQYAWGSIGVSLIGNYEEVDVPSAMQSSLVELIAWKGNLHFVDPTGHGFYIDKDLPNVMGHRDGAATECPGKYAYARLPAVRQAALTRMAALPPNVRIDRPANQTLVSGIVETAATGSPAVTRVTFFVDGQQQSTDSTVPFSFKWNTTAMIGGEHQLKAQARTALALLAESTVTVTVDNLPPSGSVTGPVFATAPTVTLRTLSDGAKWMLLSNSWLWEGEDLRHQVGQAVNDADAWNGTAWLGRAADPAGWWYGPYFKALPTGYSYRVYFRLKAQDNSSATKLATLDVCDKAGTHVYASQELTGQDLIRARAYVEPFLDFSYYQRDASGLEFRTAFAGGNDLYLDRVHLFRSPRAYASSVEWVLEGGDGRKQMDVRYLDAAGNASAVYSTTIVLDTALPQWLEYGAGSVRVRDETSGLHVSSAEYSTSSDGGATWGTWQPASIDASEGSTQTATLSSRLSQIVNIRFRIEDRAGNRGESPVYGLPTPVASGTSQPPVTGTATPSASPTQTRSPTASATSSTTPSPVASSTPTASSTAVATSTPTVTVTDTPSPSPTPTGTATNTPSPSPTPSPTATEILVPAVGSLHGRVLLQGRRAFDGATILVSDGISTITDEDGRYFLASIPVGSVTVTVRLSGYLEAVRPGVSITEDTDLALPDLTLRGGDPNGDCNVNLSDLVIVSSNFASSPPRDPRADLNRDGRVDLQDLLLVTINLWQRCPSAWNP